jgi:hypothetical protein
MAKLIIYAKGHPLVNGLKRMEFLWVEKYGSYLYLGRELDEHEFNIVVEKAMNLYRAFYPLVKVVDISEPAPAPAKSAPSAELDIDESGPREITVAEALEVMERLAPHRLKKQPGPQRVTVPA